MIRGLLTVIAFCLALGACTQRTVCPAFQSAFIYDKEALRKKFSYFQEDSTPKVLTASKNQYLVAEAVPYRKKLNSLATIEMKDVNPVVPDSLTMDDEVSLEELDRAARSVIDSIYIVDVDRSRDTVATGEDSVYVITKDKEVRVLRFDKDSIKYNVDEVRYNVDQDNYMWYLRDYLVLPDVRLAQVQGNAKEAAQKKKKGIGGFFSNLFKKKKKKQAEVEEDTTALETPVEKSEFDLDYNESDELTEAPTEEPEQKKGLFSFLKKGKDKTAKTSNGDEPAEPKKKKEKKKKEKKPKVKKGDAEPAEEEPPAEEPAKQGDDGF